MKTNNIGPKEILLVMGIAGIILGCNLVVILDLCNISKEPRLFWALGVLSMFPSYVYSMVKIGKSSNENS